MLHPDQNASRGTRHSPLSGGILVAALLAVGTMLNACDHGQPTEPDRAAPERPALALNPACDPGLGGQTHTDSILAPQTWTPAGNPHRVTQIIHVEGAGVLTLRPGVLVCLDYDAALWFNHGGRLVANGLDTLGIVLTASNTLAGWWGMQMQGSPSGPSSLKNIRVEHVGPAYAVASHDNHVVRIDSAVFRRSEGGIYLWSPGSSLRRSRVDTLSNPYAAAVTLGRKTSFQQNVIRGAAGVGLAVLGTDSISLLGGRIEESAGVGLLVTTSRSGFISTQPIRVTGGAGYPAQMDVGAFARIYALVHQDSLLGNARDTVVVAGGVLAVGTAYARPVLPWYVTETITVQASGLLSATPGSTLTFSPFTGVHATNGGRVSARGTQAAPVFFSGDTWTGIELDGAPAQRSYLTNVRIQGTQGVAVFAKHPHPVAIDSAVFRQNGAAAWLWSPRSRISRSRVDTTTAISAAVMLMDSATLESTRIRGSADQGLVVTSRTATVRQCEIRESAGDGIQLWDDTSQVHDCNLVDNAGVGISILSTFTANVENNWWGDAAGPTGPGGDGVSGALDHTPWRTAPYVLPYVP